MSATGILAVTVGFLMPILGCLKNRNETLISERFHLGGIAYLRGFQYKGLGDRAPRRDGAESSAAGAQSPPALTSDALGGDIFARVRAAVCAS
jgi:outer membrane protein assembly factor BamA